ncbi:MAG TPA: hypothetical protein P5279_03385 [Anaerohalosphaeraceae bacterium]|nr:hypothetical protein [Anaerohalosphaeraceae bacterium]HRT49514.1 hypothetical protein [Anaerohalosphaeraceae bacterium]HRT85324.1 hypothetical protein [Anaerohalosphaeraceae bacterium]
MSVAAMVLIGLLAGLGCCGLFVSMLLGVGVLFLVRLLLAGTYCAPDVEADDENQPFAESPADVVTDAAWAPLLAAMTIERASTVSAEHLVRFAGVVRVNAGGDKRDRLQTRYGFHSRHCVLGNGVCAGRSRGPPGLQGEL